MQRAAEEVEKIRKRQPGMMRSCFGQLIPDRFLETKTGQRHRGFDTATTFWAFLGQTFRNGSCRDGLHEVQAARAAAGLELLSASTSSYCTARKERLSIETLQQIHGHVGKEVGRSCESHQRWNGRNVYAVDGTSVAIADTLKNQKAYPQPSNQKPGCGFPVVQIVGLFDMNSGALLDFELSPLTVHENALFHGKSLMNKLEKRDVLVADRAYCSYINFAKLKGVGADIVARLHQARKPDFPSGCSDIIVTWNKPKPNTKPDWVDKDEWNQYPDSISVRYIKIRIEEDGYRPSEIIIATTLMDESAHEVAQLHLKRWSMEMSLYDLKTTLGMDDLMVQSPEMAHKTILMYLIAHNLIRWTMIEASKHCHTPLQNISFKGTLNIIEHWKSGMQTHTKPAQQRRHWAQLLRLIAEDKVPRRPGRSEPRAVKRRPKKYQRLTKHRSRFVVSPSRRQK